MISRQLLDSLFFLGRLLSPFYRCLMAVRAALYRQGLLPSVKLGVPVICVGNLTMGGTGKTPMVKHLAGLLATRQLQPAVLSRGYGGRLQAGVNVVSDGEQVLLSAREAGDEPVLLARALPGVPVLCGARRSVTGRYAVDRGLAKVLIMDDGFQHLALRRDLDIVLFHAPRPLGNGRVFPAGEMRESLAALRRADCFVLTGGSRGLAHQTEPFRAQLQTAFPSTPLFEAFYQPTALLDGQGGLQPLAKLRGTPLFAFCGIAQPEAFLRLAAPLFDIQGSQVFTDHHQYCQADLDALGAKAKAAGCRALLVTEKDLVKLENLHPCLPLWALKIALVVDRDFDRFVLGQVAAAGA